MPKKKSKVTSGPIPNLPVLHSHEYESFFLEQSPVFQAFGRKKQAVFVDIFSSTSVDISNGRSTFMVTTVYTEKIKEQIFNYQRK